MSISSINYSSNPFASAAAALHDLPKVCESQEKMSLEEFATFCKSLDSDQLYQDVMINGEFLLRGTNLCENRWKLIEPVFKKFNGHFSVLDLGAGQVGYFSSLIGRAYPKAECVMVEHFNEKEKHYGHHQDMLYQACQLNSHQSNLTYLNKEISVPMLEELNRDEHFDVVLAMLVVHQVDCSMDVRKQILDTILKLGNHVILEVSNDVAPELWHYVQEELSKCETHSCQFMGEVDRYYEPEKAYGGKYKNGKGEFYLFTKKNLPESTYSHAQKQLIKLGTYTAMNGIFPYNL